MSDSNNWPDERIRKLFGTDLIIWGRAQKMRDGFEAEIATLKAQLAEAVGVPSEIRETIEAALTEWQEALNTRAHIYIVDDLDETCADIDTALSWLASLPQDEQRP